MSVVRRRPESIGAPRRGRRKRYAIDKKRLVLSAVLLILGVELALAAFTSPFFAVKKIRPVGNKTIPAAEIVQRAKLPGNSNIFLVRKGAVASRLTKNPVVKEVRVYRKLPDTLLVCVEERQPHLVLSTAGVLYEVDSSGVPFRVVKRVGTKLPVISCTIPGRVALGKRLDALDFASAMECLLLAREKKIFRVTKITVDRNDDLCLNVRDEFQVKLGRAEQLSKKLDIAAQAMEQIPECRQRGKYIDMTCPEAPALKLRE